MTSISTKTKLKSEANKFLIKFASMSSSGNEVKISPISIENFSKEFLKHSEAVHTYWTNYTYKQTFGFFNSYFTGKLITEIGASDIYRYFEYRINKASIYQADLINIAAAFNMAIVQGYLTENPCKDVKRIKVPQKLTLYFSLKDFNKLLGVIDSEDILDITIFAVNYRVNTDGTTQIAVELN